MISISIHLKTQTHIRDHGAVGGGGGSLYQRSGITIRFSCGKCSLPYRQCSMVEGDQIILRYCNPALHYFNNIKDLKFVRSRQPGIISLMSYSLLWFVKINTELLRGVFTTQRFDTPV